MKLQIYYLKKIDLLLIYILFIMSNLQSLIQETLLDLKKINCKNEKISEKINTIKTIISKYKTNLDILEIAFTKFSQISMEINNVNIMLKHNIIKLLLDNLETNITEWKICWLICSIIWNIARHEKSRKEVGINGIEIIKNVINIHLSVPLVLRTSLGALSNLIINDNNKLYCKNLINPIFRIIKDNMFDKKILTSAFGFLTNMAYNEEFSKLMIPNDNIFDDYKPDAILYIIKCLKKYPTCHHLHRNASALLLNLNLKNKFKSLCKYNGIEILLKSKKFNDDNNMNLITEFLNFNEIEKKTTSLHIACKYNDYLNVNTIILNKKKFFDLNKLDDNNETPIITCLNSLLSIENIKIEKDINNKIIEKIKIIQLLISYGCDTNEFNTIINNIENKLLKKYLLNVNIEGKKHINIIKKKLSNVIMSKLKFIPNDIANCISNYCSPIDLTKNFNIEINHIVKPKKC